MGHPTNEDVSDRYASDRFRPLRDPDARDDELTGRARLLKLRHASK
jgi:hypothetical protein